MHHLDHAKAEVSVKVERITLQRPSQMSASVSSSQKSTHPDAIDFKALCGTNLVRIPPRIGQNECVVVHRGKVQCYLANKKQHFPRTPQQDYAESLMGVLGGGAVSYERGTPVPSSFLMSEVVPLYIDHAEAEGRVGVERIFSWGERGRERLEQLHGLCQHNY